MTDPKLKSYVERYSAAQVRLRRISADMAAVFSEAAIAGIPRGILCVEVAKSRDRRRAAGEILGGHEFIYFARIIGHDLVKIGVTSNLPGRLRALESQCDFRIDLLGTVDGGALLEEAIHHQLAGVRVRDFGITELFVFSAVERDVMSMIERNSAVIL